MGRLWEYTIHSDIPFAYVIILCPTFVYIWKINLIFLIIIFNYPIIIYISDIIWNLRNNFKDENKLIKIMVAEMQSSKKIREVKKTQKDALRRG